MATGLRVELAGGAGHVSHMGKTYYYYYLPFCLGAPKAAHTTTTSSICAAVAPEAVTLGRAGMPSPGWGRARAISNAGMLAPPAGKAKGAYARRTSVLGATPSEKRATATQELLSSETDFVTTLVRSLNNAQEVLNADMEEFHRFFKELLRSASGEMRPLAKVCEALEENDCVMLPTVDRQTARD